METNYPKEPVYITDQYASHGEHIGSKITYWSAYDQCWHTVYSLDAIPARDFDALPSEDRDWLLACEAMSEAESKQWSD